MIRSRNETRARWNDWNISVFYEFFLQHAFPMFLRIIFHGRHFSYLLLYQMFEILNLCVWGVCIFWVVIMFVKVSNISDVSNIKTRMLWFILQIYVSYAIKQCRFSKGKNKIIHFGPNSLCSIRYDSPYIIIFYSTLFNTILYLFLTVFEF